MMKTVLVLVLVNLIGSSIQTQVGVEDGRITDAQITASSCFDGNHCTDRARLNQPNSGALSGAWSARANNQDQYLQVDLRQLHEVTGVMTQGRHDYSQWVTSFKVLYSLDGLAWTIAKNALMEGSQIFTGNSDRGTVVTNDFTPEIVARFIRIIPVAWDNHISMRFDIIGKVVPKVEGAQKELGMKDGQIPDNAITASSEYNAHHGATRARLDTVAGGGNTGAWSARTNDPNQWIQVDLKSFYILHGVILQGRQDADQWVTSFKVAHSEDGRPDNWKFLADCDGDEKVLDGNKDRNTKITTLFERPVVGRFIRIHPVSWNGHISMRLEIIGQGGVAGHRFEPLKLGMEDGRIADNQITSSSCYNANHCVNRARLNQLAGGGQTGAWSARINDHSQWIQVDLLTNYELKGIVTQGRSDADQWVMAFSLQFRRNGQSDLTDVVDDDGDPMVFKGNGDRDSLVMTILPVPVTARYVRIIPQRWIGHISMRFELLGDGPIDVVAVPGKLGIEGGRIPSSSLSASSCFQPVQCADRSRLNQPLQGSFKGAWSAKVNDLNQWIQVDLRAAFEVTGVITQGRNDYDGWVESFQMSYSIDGKDWILVAGCNSEAKIFLGNSDRDSPVDNPISPPITARFFRLHPLTWNNHISLRWELVGEGPISLAGSSRKLGLEDYRVPDGAMTASTEYDSNHGARRARLNLRLSGSLRGAWSARVLDHSQWLQVDLRGTYRVTGIITQGRADADQWVTRYMVAHSKDGVDFNAVLATGSRREKLFDGNNDRNTQITNSFNPPLTTRFLRVIPFMWNRHISMRMELLGSGPMATVLNDPIPLGLESKIIPDESITASSEWDSDHGPRRARLNLAKEGDLRGAWSARANNANQWIQVDLSHRYRIISVATQGRQDHDQWVTTYKLACSLDGVTFDTAQGICTNPGADRVFTGNSDRNTIVTNALPVPRVCRYVRLLPVTWNGHISLRMELYGEGPLKE